MRFTRDVGNITMDLNGVETVDFNALGGADTITVGDLTGTDVTEVNLDLGVDRSGAGDGAADAVIVNGTNGNDDDPGRRAAATSSSVDRACRPSSTSPAPKAPTTRWSSTLGGGNDTIDAAALPAGVVKLTVDGGAGNDTDHRQPGRRHRCSAATATTRDRRPRQRHGLPRAGNDTFVWDPGDGSDIVEGQDGIDTMVFNGAEHRREHRHLRQRHRASGFTRDVGNITMDLNGVEQINFNALGGADTVTVNDLTGTDVTQVKLEPGVPSAAAGATARPTAVIVNGTAGDDNIVVGSDVGGGVKVGGLAATVNICGPGGATRHAHRQRALAATTPSTPPALQAGAIRLTINGGDGDDTIIGSHGDDLVNGGRGNDTALLGAGDDTFVWNPGDGSDMVEGQAGDDTMLFNGANIDEKIDISANGTRVRLHPRRRRTSRWT